MAPQIQILAEANKDKFSKMNVKTSSVVGTTAETFAPKPAPVQKPMAQAEQPNIFSTQQEVKENENDFWQTVELFGREEIFKLLDFNSNNTLDENEVSVISATDGDEENLSVYDVFAFDPESPEVLYNKMGLDDLGMNKDVFLLAMEVYENLDSSYKTTDFFAILDTTQGNDDKRYYVLNMNTQEVVFQTDMRLGKKTGNTSIKGANKQDSNETLSGVYTVGTDDKDLYYSNAMGKYAKRMDGVEDGINDQLRAKSCVIHDDNNPEYSLGCLAFGDPVHEDGASYTKEEMKEYIDTNFPDGMTIFVYPPEQYLQEYLDLSELA